MALNVSHQLSSVLKCFVHCLLQLYYIEEGETIFFFNLSPDEEMDVNTYTAHTWFVLDLDTRKVLHVNGHKDYVPKESDIYHRIRVYITIPSS